MTFEVRVNESLARFVSARMDELESTVSDAGPGRVAWLTFRDEAGQILYRRTARLSAATPATRTPSPT